MNEKIEHSKRVFLSPSRLSLFKECKRCFWQEVNKGLRRPSGAFPSLPGGMDIALKKLFDKHRLNGCLPVEIQNKLEGHLFSDMQKLDVWRNNFKGLQYIDEDTGVGLRGALDDLFVTDDGCHIPLDFKTRGFPLKDNTADYYQHQMNLYSYLLGKNGMKVGNFACLLFYHPTEAEGNGRFRFAVDLVKVKTSTQDAEKLFKDAIETLRGSEPDSDSNCGWCNWLTEYR